MAHKNKNPQKLSHDLAFNYLVHFLFNTILLVVVPDTGSKKSSTRKGVILLHFIGKFGGFAVALDSSGQEHKLLVASIKG